MASQMFCVEICHHFDCEVERARWLRAQASKGNPWRSLEPVIPVPLSQPLFEADASSQAAAKAGRRLVLRSCKYSAPIVGVQLRPEAKLGFKFITPRDEVERIRKASLRLKERRFRASKDGQRLKIAGVYCPPIRGSWMAYIRKVGESVRSHKRRVRGMVAALRLGQQLRAAERLEELSIPELFKRDLYLGLAQESNLFLHLLKVQEDSVEGTPLPSFNWRKLRQSRPARVINEAGALWADRMLARKMKLERLRQDALECLPRQRQRMNAVLLRDRVRHTATLLRYALENAFREAVRKDPDQFIGQDSQGIQGEMDDVQETAHGTTVPAKTDKKSNVVLEEQSTASVSAMLPPAPVRDEYACLAATEHKPSPASMADRWINLYKCTWPSTNGINSELFSLSLPQYVLETAAFANSPVYQLFRSHTLWRGNMRLKFQINSNARQYGQLQVRFYYGANFDANFKKRNNIYIASQMPHILLTAASSNSGEMLIPFEYINPFLTVSRGVYSWDVGSDVGNFAHLGQLVGIVVVPINAASTTPKNCELVIKISFEDNEFTGLIDASLNEYKAPAAGEMFNLAAMFAVNEMANALDKNRDKPTMSAVGTPMIPVNSGSWCMGTGLPEFTNVLRLNPRGVTPYGAGRVPPVDEMSIDYVKNVFGMFKVINWTPQHSAGHLLFKFDAAPALPLSDYPYDKLSTGETVYAMPPVGVLASMFAWWRGSLELRIDVVGAQELTGRLMIAYIPKYFKEVSLDVAANCTNVVYDFQQKNRQISFMIPFFSERMFWERHRQLEDQFVSTPPPGTVYIFVQNTLVPNSTIPSDCYLVLYLRGGPDFELSVPANPLIASCFFPKIESATGQEYPVETKLGYYPIGCGTWRYMKDNISIFRYGSVTDHVAQFKISGTLLESLYIPCKLHESNNYKNLRFVIDYTLYDAADPYKSRAYAEVFFKKVHWVMFFRDSGGYIYGVPLLFPNGELKTEIKQYFESAAYRAIVRKMLHDVDKISFNEMANLLSLHVHNGFGTSMSPYFYANASNFDLVADPDGSKKRAFIETCRTGSDWTWETSGGSDKQIQSEYADPATGMKFKPLLKFNPYAINADMEDERSSTDVAPSVSMDTACGKRNVAMKVFGERFMDLKDLCRRYQLYASGNFTVTVADSKRRTVILKFPAIPQGLDLIVKRGTEVSEYWNRTREGVIPLIASGYRFFTGSLRFRLCLDPAANFSQLVAKIFVQHRPDVLMKDLHIDLRTVGQVDNDDIELPGYATYYQYDTMNNVISFEIPFYLPVVRSWLQRPVAAADNSMHRWSHLGQIAIGLRLEADKGSSCAYDLYYSLGDDARFSVFTGFPQMIDLTRVNPTPVVSSTAASSTISESDFEEILGELKNPEGMVDWIWGSNAGKAMDTISQVDPEKINSALDSVTETTSFLESFKSQIKTFIPTVEGVKTKIEKYMSLVINVITNLIHCLLNLNIRSIVVSIISIFSQIKLVSIDFTSKLVDSLYRLFSNSTPSEQNEGVVPQMEIPFDPQEYIKEDNSCKAAYISTLIAGVAATLGITLRSIGTTWKSFGLILFDGIHKFAMTANTLFTFIKNNLIAIQKIGNYLIDGSPKMKDIEFLRALEQGAYEWAMAAIEATDPMNEYSLFTSMVKASKVYELQTKGYLIMLQMKDKILEPCQRQILFKLVDRITNLKDRLVKSHMAPPVRFEPFVYELTGCSGTGKSSLLNIIPIELLRSMGMTFPGEIIYHRNLGCAYWNNCRNQPVCSIDEKFPIEKPGFDDVQIAELFQLKSRCVFNPPMADLPDKNLRYNPLIVQYASNHPFPKLTGILDPTALFRRRDCLIKVEFTQECENKYKVTQAGPLNIKNFCYEDSRTFKCLKFSFAINPAAEDTVYGPSMTYPVFLQTMKDKWYAYYRRESVNFERDLAMALSLATPEDVKHDDFTKMWMDKIEMTTGDDSLREFRDAYHALLAEQKEKKFLGDTRACKVFQLLQKLTGFSNPTSDEKMAELKILIENHRKELIESAWPQVLGDKGKKVGQMQSDELAECSYDDFRLLIDEIKENKPCVHAWMQDVVHRLGFSAVKYDNSKNCYKIPEYWSTMYFNSVNCRIPYPDRTESNSLGFEDYGVCLDKSVKTLDNPLGNILDEVSSDVFVSYSACKNENCPFKDQLTVDDFIRNQVKGDKMHQAFMDKLQFNMLCDRVPPRFMEILHNALPPSEKTTEERKEEIGFMKGWYNRIRDSLMNVDWKKWLYRLSIVLAVFFFFGSLFKLWQFWDQPNGQIEAPAAGLAVSSMLARTVEGNVHASGDARVGSAKVTPKLIAAKTLQSTAQAQMFDAHPHNTKNLLRRNAFLLAIYSEDDKLIVGRCLGLCHNHALIVDHYWDTWKSFSKEHKTTKVRLIPLGSDNPTAIELDFNDLKYEKYSNSSLGLLTLPKRIPSFRDIRSKFLNKSGHGMLTGNGVIMEGTADKLNPQMVTWYAHHVDYSANQSIRVDGTKYFNPFNTSDCYKYKDFSGIGCCGSILTTGTTQLQIIGMHVAGDKSSGGFGYAEIVYSEMFAHLKGPSQAPEKLVAIGANSGWYLDAEVMPIGKVAARFTHRANEKSRIIPSVVQRAVDSPFPVTTGLAVLSPKDPRIVGNEFSPMIEGCKHHGKPLRQFPQKLINRAKEDLQNLIVAKCKPARINVGLLTRMQSIAGIEGLSGYDSLEWNTSEGFPWSSLRPVGAKDKRWLFKFDKSGKCIDYSQNLDQIMDEKWGERCQNLIPETVFVDCLKDCKIAKEKVLEKGKTRVFSISPVDFTIQQRQCTLDFVNAYMLNRMDLEHAIGINPDSMEWTTLAENLLSDNRVHVADGDYSKFGDTIPFEIIEACYEIIIEWYRVHGNLSQEHEQNLKIMTHEIGHSQHLMFNFVYQAVCGQPSGNSLTVIINSMANSIYMRIAWLILTQNTPYLGLDQLHKHVKFYSYGDDLIFSLTDEIKEVFNAERISILFSLYKLKFTNADKGDKMIPYRNLSEAEFLKRGFLVNPLRKDQLPLVFLAPLGDSSIIDTVNWVSKDSLGLISDRAKPFVLMSIQVCQDALRTSFGRGPEYYTNFKKQLTDFWARRLTMFIAPLWEDLDSRVFDHGEILLDFKF